MAKIIGYHGTSSNNIDVILKEGFIISNKKNEWLGRGIYFFDNDWQAKWWCNQKKYSKFGIIEVEIIYERILDLDRLKDREIYQKSCFEYKKELEKKKIYFENEEEAKLKIQCLFLTMYKEKNNIDVIKKTFNLEKIRKLPYDVLTKTHTQYCVSSEKNINNRCIHYLNTD